MGFQQEIMGLAREIQSAAIKRAYENQEVFAPGNPETGAPGPILPPYQNVSSVEQYYANIPSLFEPFSLLPDPGSYQSMIDNLRDAMGYLRTPYGGGSDLTDQTNKLPTVQPEWGTFFGPGSDLPDWNGDAAMAFKNHFYGPLKAYMPNELSLISLLRSSVLAQQALWKNAQQDIRDIANKTKDSLGHYGPCTDTTAWVIAFAVLAAVGTLAVPLLPIIIEGEIVVAETTVTAIVAGASVGGTIAPIVAPNSDPPRYSGDTAAKIIEEMQKSMTDLTQRITNVQKKIHENLTTMLEGNHRHKGIRAHKRTFVPPRPNIADQPIDQK